MKHTTRLVAYRIDGATSAVPFDRWRLSCRGRPSLGVPIDETQCETLVWLRPTMFIAANGAFGKSMGRLQIPKDSTQKCS